MPDRGIAALESAVERSIPRLLTLVDRLPLSPNHGSADRSFWHYRVDKDYPSATFAMAAWPLALLARGGPLPRRALPDPGYLAELSLAAMGWWASLQHDDGSVDEWFPFERSHVATAFTAFGVAEAALALGDRFASWSGRGTVMEGLRRSAGWLAANLDLEVANHAAGAIAAFASIGALDETLVPAGALAAQAGSLAALQDPEGFFPEYGGADPGYATVSLAFLAHAARRAAPADRPRLEELAAPLLGFLAPLVPPDGSFGGEHGRRATRYAWLSGPALLAGASPVAAALLRRLLRGVARGSLPGPETFDDRYFCFFALPDAVATLAILGSRPESLAAVAAAPEPEPADVSLPRAGLAVRRRGALHVVLGARVGGVVKVFHASGRLLHDDCGYVGRFADGRLVGSWRQDAEATLDDEGARSAGPFAFFTRDSPVAEHPIAFRVFNETVGRVPAASRTLATVAKRRFTGALRPAELHLARTVRVTAGRVEIRDELRGSRSDLPRELRRISGFAPPHVPSAPLWLPAFDPALGRLGPDVAPLLAGGAAEIVTTLVLGDGHARLEVRCGDRLLDARDALIAGDAGD